MILTYQVILTALFILLQYENLYWANILVYWWIIKTRWWNTLTTEIYAIGLFCDHEQ